MLFKQKIKKYTKIIKYIHKNKKKKIKEMNNQNT